ncbi:hypothetical protein IW261DRAFT_881259 [Armillaria novae-zelandiae]|uniref:Uncharacterized protein n=1 Tax=Armillaria novae-zelandiae TaxID=153914 RepID=A0AA39PJB9_9AGAR|nr:hypothetical protein IW261DRAFT_881259 [Armillaria novae-zelandiae]
MNLFWAFLSLDTITGTLLPVDILLTSRLYFLALQSTSGQRPCFQGITIVSCLFRCQITPRVDSWVKLIKATFLDVAETFINAENGIYGEDKE